MDSDQPPHYWGQNPLIPSLWEKPQNKSNKTTAPLKLHGLPSKKQKTEASAEKPKPIEEPQPTATEPTSTIENIVAEEKKETNANFITQISFKLNNQNQNVSLSRPNELLVDYLRNTAKLTGIKYACGEGGCGACTVIIGKGKNAKTVNSCMTLLASINYKEVTTIEGIADSEKLKKQLQEPSNNNEDENPAKVIAENNGTQCGYCTPGFVTSMKCYLDNTNKEERKIKDIEDLFDGHLCRCTGYRPILFGFKSYANDGTTKEKDETPPLVINDHELYSSHHLMHKNVRMIEPAVRALKAARSLPRLTPPTAKILKIDGCSWTFPATLADVFRVLEQHKENLNTIKLVVGNTWQGLHLEKKFEIKHFVDMNCLPELKKVEVKDGELIIGAAATINAFKEMLKSMSLTWLEMHLRRVGTTQVRNVASVTGNVIQAKQFSNNTDIALLLDLLGAKINYIQGNISENNQSILVKDFIGNLDPIPEGHIIGSFQFAIPQNDPNRCINSYKLAKRFQNSRSLVNAGFDIQLNADGSVKRAVVVVGGFASASKHKIHHLQKVELLLQNSNWKQGSIKDLFVHALTEFQTELLSQFYQNDQAKPFNLEFEHYSRTALGFFYKFLLLATKQFLSGGPANIDKNLYETRITKTSVGKQVINVTGQKSPVTEPVMKNTAYIQATGEAMYTQDIKNISDLHHGVYVLSTRAHAVFTFAKGVRDAILTEFPGVAAFITFEDVTYNILEKGPSVHTNGDTVFAPGVTIYYGQPVAMVVAPDIHIARNAARIIQEDDKGKYIIYQQDKPVVLDIEKGQRLDEKSRIDTLKRGEIPEWEKVKAMPGLVTTVGSVLSPSQYHFYMETQSAVAQPTPTTMIVYASTQSPSTVQGKVALVLGKVPFNSVEVKVNQVGGGFGGKEPQSVFVACSAAIAAKRLGKPVSVMLDRNTDMSMIGKRHAFLGKYHVAAEKETGIIKYLKLELISDAGCSYDVSFPVMDLAVLSADNAYNIENFEVTSECRVTNKASSTAFRSFGVVQSTTITESAIQAIAEKLNMDPDEVRFKNFYREIDGVSPETHFGQKLTRCNLDKVWNQLKNDKYEERKKKIADFNKANKFKKRGCALIPLKYGISFTRISANQATALVQVFNKDGSVILSHCGIEMGQGLTTKLQQIASRELGVRMSLIQMQPYSSHSHVNAPSTGASTGTDLNGGAVEDACKKLAKALTDCIQDYAKAKLSDNAQVLLLEAMWEKMRANPELVCPWREIKSYNGGLPELDFDATDKNWQAVIALAYESRISLASHGHFASPGITRLDENRKGNVFYYFNYAAAYSEVEIDVLTGEHIVRRTSIVYDAGESLNPAIDVGQVEGGFIQGLGNMTTEELDFDTETGKLTNNGTWEYKIPCSRSIPLKFEIELLYENLQQQHLASDAKSSVKFGVAGVQSAKTTGEPPLVLANTVFFAIRNAVRQFRKDNELPLPEDWRMDPPATVKEIQRQCHGKEDYKHFIRILCADIEKQNRDDKVSQRY